ncbi:DUF2934 domain-containing protein [Shinella kummerowiae]|jgi:hypothetical protein|uniref:DUF2934 domain-containing protein n=1 Tax=Shinella kummerowiae TaxID=417745 RepID=A0A6N8SQF2_9HYPH|nr:DUF2934 domain-containing protein [Shinella kummerowiae]MCT7668030.1 DUF2934 domain-containing protein [Shinella kummerowiae]MXN49232.1 DUF2934 domain-containing protein [Shinella kummerowiae]
MVDKEQRQRERAYKIWEDEGHPDGRHADHWRRAGEEGQLSDQNSDDVTRVNQQADDEFARGDREREPAHIKPPSVANPD